VPPQVPSWEALGNTRHATTTRDINPKGDTARDQALAEAPAAAQRLLDATNHLAGVAPNPDHIAIADALQRLADAIASVAPDEVEAVSRVRESAGRLARSSEQSPAHTAFVRAGLEAAASALRLAPMPNGADPSSVRQVRDSADAVARAATALDPATPLMKQYQNVQLALRESTRAVYARLGEPQPVLAVPVTASR
jgi:hypothetical protein